MEPAWPAYLEQRNLHITKLSSCAPNSIARLFFGRVGNCVDIVYYQRQTRRLQHVLCVYVCTCVSIYKATVAISQQETPSLKFFYSSGQWSRWRMNRISWAQEWTYLLEHHAVLVVTDVIRSKPSSGQHSCKVHRFFLRRLKETFNQEGLQWRPRVREVPLFAGIVHGGRRATYGETSESFLTQLFLSLSPIRDICTRQIRSGQRKSIQPV